MLYNEIAEQFITKLTAYTKYNINIMDDKGIIIASRNPERIGSFHEAAFDIISNNLDIIHVSDLDNMIGTRPGVNLPLTHQGKVIGVIGVTGNPEEVHPIALIVKMSMETMLDYEALRERDSRRQNLKEQFFSQLIYNTNVSRAELKKQASQLSYSEKHIRIPIFIRIDDREDLSSLLARIKEGNDHTSQDISMVTRENGILIYKCLPDHQDIFSDYKYILAEYLHDYLMYSKENGLANHFYVGTMQDQFNYYSCSYQHCLWLEKHYEKNPHTVYFYDHVDHYMKSIISEIEYHRIFNCLGKKLDEKYISSYKDTLQALKENNYNLVTASRQMYVHKNTLAFRFEKLKKRLNMNPIRSSGDREFMEYLLYYLQQKK